jgi:phage/conjugal plasmid C-4 type zinc finger TraR family protein
MDIADIAQLSVEWAEIPLMVQPGEGTTHCVDCGEKIPEARKAAYPPCIRCAECQEDWER